MMTEQCGKSRQSGFPPTIQWKEFVDDNPYCDTWLERRTLLERYFSVSTETLEMLLSLPRGPIRKEECERLNVNQHILRTMLEYTRYPGAIAIKNALEQIGIEIAKLTIVDFGCLVADYGMYFSRYGANIRLYDRPRYTTFAAYRFSSEGHKAAMFIEPTDYKKLFGGANLAIFGEVLEHLNNPMDPISACFNSKVQFIFTSCYPFGDDHYFSRPGHSLRAQGLQDISLQFLRKHYVERELGKKARIWKMREAF